ncbi:MAG: helix-turn-helix transcriptional regulator [Symploca sp. SIO2D2]|nr:helix-turn-helix transcriptional regulator [Symploca sp. SIO2D2]
MSNPLLSTLQTCDSAPEWYIRRQWGPLGILYCRHTCHYETGADQLYFKDEHTLGLFLSPRPFRFSHQQENHTAAGFYSKGDLLITPADTPLLTHADGNVEIVQIRLKDDFVRTVAEEALAHNGDCLELLPTFQTRAPQIESIIIMLLTELQQEWCGNQLYIDSLANVLAINLLRNHTTTQPQIPLYKGGLPQRQLLKVLDYIDAHLSQEVTLGDLAQQVDMSQFHFGRLFKQSLGISPYQYLLEQRIERAKQLLKQTDQPIVNIALDCGFSSHSHLNRKFRQLTGMTPKAYRTD